MQLQSDVCYAGIDSQPAPVAEVVKVTHNEAIAKVGNAQANTVIRGKGKYMAMQNVATSVEHSQDACGDCGHISVSIAIMSQKDMTNLVTQYRIHGSRLRVGCHRACLDTDI